MLENMIQLFQLVKKYGSFHRNLSMMYNFLLVFILYMRILFSETEYELQKLEKGFKDVGKEKANEIAELKKKVSLLSQITRGQQNILKTNSFPSLC